jgi:hypothetical protein
MKGEKDKRMVQRLRTSNMNHCGISLLTSKGRGFLKKKMSAGTVFSQIFHSVYKKTTSLGRKLPAPHSLRFANNMAGKWQP